MALAAVRQTFGCLKLIKSLPFERLPNAWAFRAVCSTLNCSFNFEIAPDLEALKIANWPQDRGDDFLVQESRRIVANRNELQTDPFGSECQWRSFVMLNWSRLAEWLYLG